MNLRLPVRGQLDSEVELGAVYTIGLNYRDPAVADDARPERPLVFGKATSSLAADGSLVT
jgi:hypothetical protein